MTGNPPPPSRPPHPSGPRGAPPDIIQLSPYAPENRFSRFELIRWWEQKRLAAAKILVIGAGALGNEILKNLALMGVGHVVVVDMDRIETSNLSRSVLFRDSDCGRFKADVVAERARELFPAMNVRSLCLNAVTDLGLGLYFWADVVIGGLDNREARLSINRNAYRAGKPWIDGAIEVLNGIARVFMPPDGPCYECTMSEIDWKMLHARRACTLLNRDEMLSGKTPTTPTIASIIAGIQCQEALKLLHGMEVIAGKGFLFEGIGHNSYVVEFKRKEDCYSHESFRPLTQWDEGIDTLPLRTALERARTDLGPEAVIELKEDVLVGFNCGPCGVISPARGSLGRIREADSVCPTCQQLRIPELAHTFDGSEPFIDQTLAEIGVPPFDVLVGRNGEQCRYYLLDGDRTHLLGEFAAEIENGGA